MQNNNLFNNPVQPFLQLGDTVKKSNISCRARTLHISSSVFNNRILAALISTIKKDDTEFKDTYTIDIKTLLEEQPNLNYWSNIKKICDDLSKSRIEVEGIEENEHIFGFYNYFTSIVYRGGLIYARFSPELKPHLLYLRENFTKYKLLEYLSLSTTYSQRLFEILKSWSGKGSAEYSIEELHELLNTPKTYRKNFKDFRVFVLEKAYKEINTKTELRFKYHLVKKGGAKSKTGKVLKIFFEIKPQKSKDKSSENETKQIQLINNIQSTHSNTAINNQVIQQSANFAPVSSPGVLVVPPVPDFWLHFEKCLREVIQQDPELVITKKQVTSWFPELGVKYVNNRWIYKNQDENDLYNLSSYNYYYVYIKQNILYIDFDAPSQRDYINAEIGEQMARAFGEACNTYTGEYYPTDYLLTASKVLDYRKKYIKDKVHAEEEQNYYYLNQMMNDPAEDQVRLLAKVYPNKDRVDVKKAVTVFRRLMKQRNKLLETKSIEELAGQVMPPLGELMRMLDQLRTTPAWTKEKGRFVPNLSNWLLQLEQKEWQI